MQPRGGSVRTFLETVIMTILQPSRGLANSAAMQDAMRRLRDAIASTGGVLLHGEPGSGRELFARAIHHGVHDKNSSTEELIRRAMRNPPTEQPFVVVDCGAQAVEERLFGAAASAERSSEEPERITAESALRQATGGTLVLRQITAMPVRAQARLARVLRDGEASLVLDDGNAGYLPVTLRTIATMDAGSTEQIVPELQRRLAESTIEVPPLRQRREDIPALVRYLLKDHCAEHGIAPKVASAQALELLAALPWKGNVRELKTLLTGLVAKVPGRMIRLVDVLASVRLDCGASAQMSVAYAGTLREARAKFERDYVSAVLEQHHGRMAEAARALGIQRTNLYRKVRQLAVKRRRPGLDAQSSHV
jgi:two-component system nitrogen regulation response regulator NtrX